MKFLPYEDVPLFLSSVNGEGEYIFAENASISVQQPLSTHRQMDDNIFNICAYGNGHNLIYNPLTFSANQKVTLTLGPTSGPPQPLATSIEKVEANTKITFPNNKHLYFHKEYKPNGHDYVVDVYAKSGDWNLTEEEAQQGVFDPLYKYSSDGPIVGSLSVNFYINSGNMPTFFNITGMSSTSDSIIDEERITGHLGDFKFNNAYLKSLSFSLSPNAISQASADFDIYGTLEYQEGLTDNYFSSDLYKQQSIAHGQESQIVGTSDFKMEHPIGFNYSISVNRINRFEAPSTLSSDDIGLVPVRSSKRKTTISMGINGENIDPDILVEGFNGKRANLKVFISDLNYQNSIDNNQGLMHIFNCKGVIQSQSLEVGSDGYLNGSITVTQELR